MVLTKRFTQIAHPELLRELRSLFDKNWEPPNSTEVERRGWVTGVMYENQIYDEDAANLAKAFQHLNLSKVYAARTGDIKNRADFEVWEIATDVEGIEDCQDGLEELSNNCVAFFSQYPTPFFFIRPLGADNMYFVGSTQFIETACAQHYWKIIK